MKKHRKYLFIILAILLLLFVYFIVSKSINKYARGFSSDGIVFTLQAEKNLKADRNLKFSEDTLEESYIFKGDFENMEFIYPIYGPIDSFGKPELYLNGEKISYEILIGKMDMPYKNNNVEGTLDSVARTELLVNKVSDEKYFEEARNHWLVSDRNITIYKFSDLPSEGIFKVVLEGEKAIDVYGTGFNSLKYSKYYKEFSEYLHDNEEDLELVFISQVPKIEDIKLEIKKDENIEKFSGNIEIEETTLYNYLLKRIGEFSYTEENMEDFLSILNDEQKIVLVNDTLLDHQFYSGGEIVGGNFSDILNGYWSPRNIFLKFDTKINDGDKILIKRKFCWDNKDSGRPSIFKIFERGAYILPNNDKSIEVENLNIELSSNISEKAKFYVWKEKSKLRESKNFENIHYKKDTSINVLIKK